MQLNEYIRSRIHIARFTAGMLAESALVLVLLAMAVVVTYMILWVAR